VSAVATALAWGGCATAAESGFAAWLDGLREEAARRGVSSATLDATLASLAPLPRVIELDRRQPEFTISLPRYLARAVSPSRVAQGRARLVQHRPLLDEVAARYGVPPAIVVALWGIETDYGRHTGGFPVIAALATLAHDGRRSVVFREELLDALRIVDLGEAPAPGLRGSWAGAMGQSQFLPSSFLRHAVDFDGDGRRDIWTSLPDVFASIANYLAASGWQPGEPWAREVRLPAAFDRGLADPSVRKTPAEWRRLGVRLTDGRLIPRSEHATSVVAPPGAGRRAFLAYENFRVLLRWNRSDLFAIAVGQLADRLEGDAPAPRHLRRRDERQAAR
jgi:membrane-bound lytic murein transglycosylase B